MYCFLKDPTVELYLEYKVRELENKFDITFNAMSSYELKKLVLFTWIDENLARSHGTFVSSLSNNNNNYDITIKLSKSTKKLEDIARNGTCILENSTGELPNLVFIYTVPIKF